MNPYDRAEANEPSVEEEELFDRFQDENPELTDSEVWALVEREREAREAWAEEYHAEYMAELAAEDWRY